MAGRIRRQRGKAGGRGYLKSIAPLLQGLAVSRGTRVDFSSLSESEQDEFINFLFERLYSTRSLLGTVESCSKLIEDLRSIGVDEIACLIDFGLDAATVMEGLNNLTALQARLSEHAGPPSYV